MWITSLGIWARGGTRKHFLYEECFHCTLWALGSWWSNVTWAFRSGLLSVRAWGYQSFTPCWAKALPKSVGGLILLPLEFSRFLWLAECTSCELLSSLPCHWTHQATCLPHWLLPQGFEGTQEMQSAPYRIDLLSNKWSFFSGNLCAWIEKSFIPICSEDRCSIYTFSIFINIYRYIYFVLS